MFWYLLQAIAELRGKPLQEQVITLAAFPKAVIVTDNYGMRSKASDKEILNILFSLQVGKGVRKGYLHEVIDAQGSQQFNSFVEGIDEPDSENGGGNDLPWVWVKGHDHRFAINTGGHGFHLVDDALVTGMNAVESADGNHGIPEYG